MSTRHKYSIAVLALALAGVLAIPAQAEAQRRGFRGRSHSMIVVSGGFGYPGIWFYDQWGPWGPYGPGPWGPYRGYPRYVVDEFSASLKLDVKPKDAEVYVDGALAGEVDDFDGIFQSLRLRPGSHEIVVYRDGFRSVREQVYLEPFNDRKLRFDLAPLKPGEAQDARPQAPAPGTPGYVPRERERDPRQGPPTREPERRMPAERPVPPAQFGTVSIRVMPADAEVFVDGERWTGQSGTERLSIRLSAGRHRIEVRKAGLTTYAEEVLIRAGATLTLNVSLK